MRLLASLLAPLLAVGLGLPSAQPVAAAPQAATRVVIVVGPAGKATDRYRAQAAEAAAVARRFTSDVVTVIAPDATWPAVKQALQGASIVVYMGHGNGWPSKYRDSLFPPTQNGFGLNAVAGGDDGAHQYFGEARVANEVRLAPNAVVVLSHLCYASGNTEPGLPEGTLDDAKQRVDNYAAGFAAAGAGAVIADAHLNPAWYVRALLTGSRSIEAIWHGAPSANGRSIEFASGRTPGYTAVLDPDRDDGAYYRSLVVRGDLAASRVRASAEGGTGGTVAALPPPAPTLAGTSVALQAPVLLDRPTAGSASRVWIPLTAPDRAQLPEAVAVSVRWDPLDVAGAGDAPESEAEPGTGAEAEAPAGPPPLVQPEVLGAVVTPEPAKIGKSQINAPLAFPERPGLYRLVTTLHAPDGIAYDAATQALIPGLLVRVTDRLAVTWQVAPAIEAQAGSRLELPVAVANQGTEAWGHAIGARYRPGEPNEARWAEVVGRWVPLGAGSAADETEALRLPPGLEPGAGAAGTLVGPVPATPGSYLLLLDVVVPDVGSLAGAGVAPALVRVTVEAP